MTIQIQSIPEPFRQFLENKQEEPIEPLYYEQEFSELMFLAAMLILSSH